MPALLAALASGLALAGCGSGDTAGAGPQQIDGIGQALRERGHAVPAAAAANAPAGAVPAPDATALMDWAERRYAAFFPGPQANLVSAPYVYRYYAATGNALGVAGQDVFILGSLSNGQLLRVGTLNDFAPFFDPLQFPVTSAEAVRFLHQAQFAAIDEDIAQVYERGYAGWLQDQFEMAHGQSGVAWLDANGYGVVDEETGYYFSPGNGDRMAWAQLFTRKDTLRTRFALALSEYFVVSITGIDSVDAWVVNYGAAGFWDLLTRHAFGNFRELLEALTLNFAMGAFLGTLNNRKEDPATGRVPDENYAREVMQLFTIGLYELNPDGTERLDAAGRRIETYSLDDVTGLARVFTGWTGDWEASKPIPVSTRVAASGFLNDNGVCRRPMVCKPWDHSFAATSFLGTHIAANTDPLVALRTALDTLFRHPNVGPFFGRQMIQRLVSSSPSPAYVRRVAATFDNNGRGVRGDLRAVLTAILLDEEARDPAQAKQYGRGKVREPMIRFVQWAHTFGDASTLARWEAGHISVTEAVGQNPLRAPSVFNFFRPGYVPPGTEMARTGATAPEFQIVNESTTASYINFIYERARNGVIRTHGDTRRLPDGSLIFPTFEVIPAPYARELPLASKPEALVARLNLLLAAGRLDAATERLIADAVRAVFMPEGDMQRARDRIAAAVVLVMSAPEYLVQK